MANSNSLILTLKTSSEIILVKDTKTQEITVGGNKYEVVLKDLSFMKKMYEPGLITADIQFKLSGGTVWKTISKKDLDTTFKSMEAELAYGKAEKDKDGKWTFPNKTTICSSYYIYQINARYLSDSLFATMVIQSVDKQLTIEEGCYSYVSQRLCRDIIEGRKREFALPYKTTDHVGYNYDNLKVICTEAAHKEAIFPYLVQYNESYYDFLVRTCNRWGEFLYFEDGKLTIGYDNSKTTDVNKYSSYNYCNLNTSSTTPTAVTNISETATYDEHMLGTKLEKGNYDTLRGVMGCSTENGGDVWAAKIIGNLLSSGKNLFDYIVDTVVDETIARQQAKDKVDNNNDNFAKNYFNPGDKPAPEVLAHYDSAKSQYNEFSDIEPILKTDLYKNVLRAEVEASLEAVCINFDTTYFHLKLGDVITIDGDGQKYIVIQVNTNEKEDMVIDFDNKTTKMVSNVVDFDYIVAPSEKEALILEYNLIKQYKPRFNIMFMDDASYPYIRLTLEDYPTLKVVRDAKRLKNAKYFGPYPNAGHAYELVDLLQQLYPLRRCRTMPNKVCLYYHLGQCLGPCEFDISKDVYSKIVDDIVTFMNGNTGEIKNDLVKRRDRYSR